MKKADSALPYTLGSASIEKEDPGAKLQNDLSRIIKRYKLRPGRKRRHSVAGTNPEAVTFIEKLQLKKLPTYTKLHSQYDVEKIFSEWFNQFSDIERADVMKRMDEGDRSYIRAFED